MVERDGLWVTTLVEASSGVREGVELVFWKTAKFLYDRGKCDVILQTCLHQMAEFARGDLEWKKRRGVE